MVRLSKMTEYAVVVLSQLAAGAALVVTASEVAGKTGLPVPTVSKILKRLARCGLVRAQRGAAGGYALARDKAEISVADIIVAMDGPISLTECVTGTKGNCSASGLCPMRGGWDTLNLAVSDALAAVSLSDMMGNIPLQRERVA